MIRVTRVRIEAMTKSAETAVIHRDVIGWHPAAESARETVVSSVAADRLSPDGIPWL